MMLNPGAIGYVVINFDGNCLFYINRNPSQNVPWWSWENARSLICSSYVRPGSGHKEDFRSDIDW